jgi:hypothetical protein
MADPGGRPLGPEPDSKVYWNLWKFWVCKWLLLNLLRLGRGKRLNFLEVRGSVCHKFTFHEAAGSKQAFSHLHYSPQNPC